MSTAAAYRLFSVLLAIFALDITSAFAWAPKSAAIMTRWASSVDPKNPWPEYPRPQFARSQWLSLNGIWQYQPGVDNDTIPVGKTLTSEILVPYPVESALSGVMESHDRVWYRRLFVVPKMWSTKHILLNFGAVDFEADVYVNGNVVGIHRGGYLPFSYDITPYLTKSGPQELIVRAYNPVDSSGEPRGKQTNFPGGIMYTSSTGIWQTVWLEPVNSYSIRDLKIVPDIDHGVVNVTVNTGDPSLNGKATITVLALGKIVSVATGLPGAVITIPIPKQKLWSPDSPFLYDLDIKLSDSGAVVDNVRSYFGMRKISIGMDHGVKKMFLNNQFVFEIGPLDQGFWPDGLYTAPTDAAMKADIQAMKSFGFNMVRKHIKVEPARWYYYTDKLGLLVWQDMPSADSYMSANVPVPPVDKPEYEIELHDLVISHWNSPSIIMWDLYNEGQGQFDTPRLAQEVKLLDPSRLVNQASGGGYFGVGDVLDRHNYPPPAAPDPTSTQAIVNGEFGGIGYLVAGHTWRSSGGGYTNVKTTTDYVELYADFLNDLKLLRDNDGLSAGVYTQLTDVETELNGLMTYDRTFKADPALIAKATHFELPVPTYVDVVPTSESVQQSWKYTLTAPTATWTQSTFDDSSWTTGNGAFGHGDGGNIGTDWTSDDIWLRRTFTLGNLTPNQVSELLLREFHDEDIDVYINGVSAYSAPGYITGYENVPIDPAALQALVLGGTNTLAVHCHQTVGGQFIDVGITQKIPAQL